MVAHASTGTLSSAGAAGSGWREPEPPNCRKNGQVNQLPGSTRAGVDCRLGTVMLPATLAVRIEKRTLSCAASVRSRWWLSTKRKPGWIKLQGKKQKRWGLKKESKSCKQSKKRKQKLLRRKRESKKQKCYNKKCCPL